MAKERLKKCCRNCVYAEWLKTKTGSRRFSYSGVCGCPLPKIEVPSCVKITGCSNLTMLDLNEYKYSIIATDGIDCPCFEPLKKKKING